MGYETARRQDFSFAWDQSSSGTVTRTITPPTGFRGKVKDLIVTVTTSFTSAGTDANVKAGISGTLGKFVDLDMATTAAGANIRGAVIEPLELAKNESLVLTFTVGDTTPVGIGEVHLSLEFFV